MQIVRSIRIEQECHMATSAGLCLCYPGDVLMVEDKPRMGWEERLPARIDAALAGQVIKAEYGSPYDVEDVDEGARWAA